MADTIPEMDWKVMFEKIRAVFLIPIVSVTEIMIRRRKTLGIAPAIAVLALLGAGVPSGLGLPVAVDQISGDGIRPSSPLYGLELAGEKIQQQMISDRTAKAQAQLSAANERLAEMQEEVNARRMEHIPNLVEMFRGNVRNAVTEAEQVGREDLLEEVTDAVARHIDTLNDVYVRISDNAPQQATDAIQKALDYSDMGHGIVVDKLEKALANKETRIPIVLPDVGEVGVRVPLEDLPVVGNQPADDVPVGVAPVDVAAANEIAEGRDNQPDLEIEEVELPDQADAAMERRP